MYYLAQAAIHVGNCFTSHLKRFYLIETDNLEQLCQQRRTRGSTTLGRRPTSYINGEFQPIHGRSPTGKHQTTTCDGDGESHPGERSSIG